MVITPTVGRIVWYWGSKATRDEPMAQPLAAIVAYVHSDRLINVMVIDQNGAPVGGRTSVLLQQEGDPNPQYGSFCTWMPYQIGQAKKHGEAA